MGVQHADHRALPNPGETGRRLPDLPFSHPVMTPAMRRGWFVTADGY
jgi:hypothetical protein